jgi:ankyrin repeat protein
VIGLRRRHIGTYAQSGRTALIWAAGQGRTTCVRLLLDAGADKNAQDQVRGRSVTFAVGLLLSIFWLYGGVVWWHIQLTQYGSDDFVFAMRRHESVR